jgi:hypothetical protein
MEENVRASYTPNCILQIFRIPWQMRRDHEPPRDHGWSPTIKISARIPDYDQQTAAACMIGRWAGMDYDQ